MRFWIVTAVAASLVVTSRSADAQQLSFTSSSTCFLERGCEGIRALAGGVDDRLDFRRENLARVADEMREAGKSVLEETGNRGRPGLDRTHEPDRPAVPLANVAPDPGPMVTATPEPATLILLATGLAGVGGAIRARRRR